MKSVRIAAFGIAAVLVGPAWGQSTAPATTPATPPTTQPGMQTPPDVRPPITTTPATAPPARPNATTDATGRPGAAPATGGSGGAYPKDPPAFASLDTDKDGYLRQSELPVNMTFGGKKLAGIDTNSDGRISPDEYAAWERDMKTKRTKGTTTP
jgi:hypothetical protein